MAKLPNKQTKYADVQKSKTPWKLTVNPAKVFAYPNNKKATAGLTPKNVGLSTKIPAKEGLGFPFRSDCPPPPHAKYTPPEKENINFPQIQSSEVSENGSDNNPNSAANSNPISSNEASQISSVKQSSVKNNTGINAEERSEKLDLDTFTVRLNRRRKHQRHHRHHLHRGSDLQGSQFALRGPANILKKARGYFSSIFGGEQPDSEDSQNAEKSSKEGYDSISSKMRSEKSEIDNVSEEPDESTNNDETNTATGSRQQSEASSRSSRNLDSDFETIKYGHLERSDISSKGSPNEHEAPIDYENFSHSASVSRVPRHFNDISSDEFGEIATEKLNFSELQTWSKSVSKLSISYSSFTEETIDLDSGATLIDIPSEILDVSERTWKQNPDKFPKLKIASKIIVPLEKGSAKGSVKSTQKRTTVKANQIHSEKLVSGKPKQKEKKKGKSSLILKQKKKEKASKKKEQKKKKKTSKHTGVRKNSSKHKKKKDERARKKKRSNVKKNTVKKDKVSNKKAKPVESKLRTESNQKVRKRKSKKSKTKSKSRAKKSKSKLKSKSKDKSKTKIKSKSKEKQQIKEVKATVPSQDQINDVKRRRSSNDIPQTRFERYVMKKRMSKVHIKTKRPKENGNKAVKKTSKGKQASKTKEKQNM